MKINFKNVAIICSFLCILPRIASANAAVPMLFLTLWSMLLALIPIILIEAVILSKILKIEFKKTIGPSCVANIVTTFIGLPLSWILTLGLQILAGSVTGLSNSGNSLMAALFESAMIYKRYGVNYPFWFFPVSIIFSLVIAYLVSVFFEYLVLKRKFIDFDRRLLKKAVWFANTVSYALLIITIIIL